VGVLLDVYHAAREEGQVVPLLERYAADSAHVQVADVPGRGRPGSGDLDFEGIFGALARVGYAGHIGLEYRPSEDAEDTFAWLPPARRGQASSHA
jgi:hydroxypyruvate isomerase